METLTQPKALPAPANLPPTAARMAEITRLRERRDEVESRLNEIDDGAIDFSVGSLRRERNSLNEQIEALETLGDGGPLLTVTLDAYASFLVRRNAAVHHARSATDVINGALAFTCGEDDDHDWPEEMHKAAARREERFENSDLAPIMEARETDAPRVHRITLELSPIQLRMFMQIADDSEGGSMGDLVRRELGQHVALHLECYHGHSLEAARERWEREGKGAA